MKTDFKPIILGTPHAYVSQWVTSHVGNIEQYVGSKRIKCYSNDEGLCFKNFIETWKDNIKCEDTSIYNMIRALIDRFNIIHAKNLKITILNKGDNHLKISTRTTITCDIHTDMDGSLWIDKLSSDSLERQVYEICGISFESLSVRLSNDSFNLWDYRADIINTYDRYVMTDEEPLDGLSDNILNRTLFVQVSPINIKGLSDGVSTWNLSAVALGLKDTAGKSIINALKNHSIAIHSVLPVTDGNCNITRECVVLYPITVSQNLDPLQYPDIETLCTHCKEDDVLSFKVMENPLTLDVHYPEKMQVNEEAVINVETSDEIFTIEMLIKPSYINKPTNSCWPSCSD